MHARRPAPILAAAVAISFVPAVVAAFFGPGGGGDWYRALAKPSWTPPPWLFGPVWTLLYALMGVAAGLVALRAVPSRRRPALALFGAQLLANAAWTPVFFGLESPGGGLAVIAVLWALLAATVLLFFRAWRPAGWLLVPSLLWASFATALNFEIWRLQGN